MAKNIRTELERELVKSFIDTKAVDFEKIGSIISKFGARAATEGTDLAVIVTKNFLINCGWPGPPIGREIERINPREF
jgi:hypothetical protein